MPHLERPDYTPTLGEYTNIRPFRAWVQAVLPQVYDDSLSYYEVLSKITAMLNVMLKNLDTLRDDDNKIIGAFQDLQKYIDAAFDAYDTQWEDWVKQQEDELNAWKENAENEFTQMGDALKGEWSTFQTAQEQRQTDFENSITNKFGRLENQLNADFNTLKNDFETTWNNWTEEQKTQYAQDIVNMQKTLENYVQAYVDGVGLQQYIDNKIDMMVQDGTLNEVIQPLLKPLITPALVEWLEEHHDELGIPPLDDTFTVKGAAADALATGNAIINTLPRLKLIANNPANISPLLSINTDAQGIPLLVWYNATLGNKAYANMGNTLICFRNPSATDNIGAVQCTTITAPTSLTGGSSRYAVVYHAKTNQLELQNINNKPLIVGDFVLAVSLSANQWDLLGNDAFFNNTDLAAQKVVREYQIQAKETQAFNVLHLSSIGAKHGCFKLSVGNTSVVTYAQVDMLGNGTDVGLIGTYCGENSSGENTARVVVINGASSDFPTQYHLTTASNYTLPTPTDALFGFAWNKLSNVLHMVDMSEGLDHENDYVIFTFTRNGSINALGNDGFITNDTPLYSFNKQKTIALIPESVSGLVINFPSTGTVSYSLNHAGRAFAAVDGRIVCFRSTTGAAFNGETDDCVVSSYTKTTSPISTIPYFLVYESVNGTLTIRTGASALEKFDYIIAVRINNFVMTYGSEACISTASQNQNYAANALLPQLTNKSQITEGNLIIRYDISAATITVQWSRTTATNGRFTFIDPWGYSLARNTNSNITHDYNELLFLAHFRASYNFQMYTITEINALTPAQISTLSILGTISHGIFTPSMPMGEKTSLTNPSASVD